MASGLLSTLLKPRVNHSYPTSTDLSTLVPTTPCPNLLLSLASLHFPPLLIFPSSSSALKTCLASLTRLSLRRSLHFCTEYLVPSCTAHTTTHNTHNTHTRRDDAPRHFHPNTVPSHHARATNVLNPHQSASLSLSRALFADARVFSSPESVPSSARFTHSAAAPLVSKRHQSFPGRRSWRSESEAIHIHVHVDVHIHIHIHVHVHIRFTPSVCRAKPAY